MALYTILFGLSIFLIALVIAVIKKVFFRWKEEHKIEIQMNKPFIHGRPACSVIIYVDKYLLRKSMYDGEVTVYDILNKSELEVTEE